VDGEGIKMPRGWVRGVEVSGNIRAGEGMETARWIGMADYSAELDGLLARAMGGTRGGDRVLVFFKDKKSSDICTHNSFSWCISWSHVNLMGGTHKLESVFARI
jgi:hypothetical protein